MKVLIPSPLRSYTGERWVEASGATLAELLADLDRQLSRHSLPRGRRTGPAARRTCASSSTASRPSTCTIRSARRMKWCWCRR
ncbi:MAG: hypothetical protein MZV65_12995 [Chromatiales bacterium]|nr:hypothetical protein [Chromatiales bacterium]